MPTTGDGGTGLGMLGVMLGVTDADPDGPKGSQAARLTARSAIARRELNKLPRLALPQDRTCPFVLLLRCGNLTRRVSCLQVLGTKAPSLTPFHNASTTYLVRQNRSRVG